MDARDIGPRLRALRQERRLSLQMVAEATDLSKSFLSLVENGDSDISIGRLVRLVKFYGVPISRLLDEEDGRQVVVTRDNRRSVPSEAEGITIHFLTPDSERKMLPLLVEIQPGGASKEPVTHEGEEFVHVVSGTVTVSIGSAEAVLQEGDSAYFNSDSPHAYRNVGSDVAIVMLVVTPPSL